MGAPATRSVEVQLPADFTGEEGEVAREMLLLWLLEQVRTRRLAFTRAAELAELSQPEFLDLMAEHRITPFDYDPEEVERELG